MHDYTSEQFEDDSEEFPWLESDMDPPAYSFQTSNDAVLHAATEQAASLGSISGWPCELHKEEPGFVRLSMDTGSSDSSPGRTRLNPSIPKGLHLPIGCRVRVRFSLLDEERAHIVILHIGKGAPPAVLHPLPGEDTTWPRGEGHLAGRITGTHGSWQEFVVLACMHAAPLQPLIEPFETNDLYDRYLIARDAIAAMRKLEACRVSFPYVSVNRSYVDDARRLADRNDIQSLRERCHNEAGDRQDGAKSSCGVVFEKVLKHPSKEWRQQPLYSLFEELLLDEFKASARRYVGNSKSALEAIALSSYGGLCLTAKKIDLYPKFVSKCNLSEDDIFETVHFLAVRNYIKTIVERTFKADEKAALTERLEKQRENVLRQMHRKPVPMTADERRLFYEWARTKVLTSRIEETVLFASLEEGMAPADILINYPEVAEELSRRGGKQVLLKNLRDSLYRCIWGAVRSRGPDDLRAAYQRLAILP